MKLDRILAITKKNLRSLRHDRRTFGFIFMVPFMMILIFGYTFGGDVEDIGVYIVNLDEGSGNVSASWLIIDDLNTSETFNIRGTFTADSSVSDPIGFARGEVENASAWAAIVFDEGFTNETLANMAKMKMGLAFEPVNFTIYLDGTNPNVARAVISEVAATMQDMLRSGNLVIGGIPVKVAAPMNLNTDLIYGEDTEFIDFFAPGIMGLAGLLVTFMLTIVTFVRERSTSTLERLLTTPVTEGEIVAGYAISFGLLALAQSSVILATAVLLFDIQIVGSTLLALLIIFLLGIGSMGLGLLFSAIAKNELQAVQFIPLVFIPSILLGGIFWPLEAIPEFLRPLSYCIPLTYAVDGARSVMIRGWGVEEVWLQVSVLLLFAIIILVVSTLSLKKRG